MRSLSVLGAAALLAVLPVAANAQSSSNQEVIVKESTTVVVKEVPKPSPVTFTPYGFFLLNTFFNDSAGTRNYPLPNQCTGGASCEGNVLFDVRQTRLGARLAFNDTAGWTKATLSALVEIDFQGGYAGAVPTGSVAFYSPVVRLRKAYADAAWALGTDSKLALRLGQDDHIVSLLRPVSLAYIANPLFQFAGTLNGRAPMAEIRFDVNPKNGITINAQAALVNPEDNTAIGDGTLSPGSAVDLGAGNRSRVPALEGRVAVGLKSGGKQLAELAAWGGWQKNRFVSPSTDTNVDTNTYIYGGDMTLNIWMVNVLGSIYGAKGWDQPGSLGVSQGIALTVTGGPSATPPSRFTITNAAAVPAIGGWFQVLVGPDDLFKVYGGWGGTQSPANVYTGTLLVSGTADPRIQNFTWAAGAIAYAGKNWRFSAEYARSTSFFWKTVPSYSQGQFSINSQVVF